MIFVGHNDMRYTNEPVILGPLNPPSAPFCVLISSLNSKSDLFPYRPASSPISHFTPLVFAYPPGYCDSSSLEVGTLLLLLLSPWNTRQHVDSLVIRLLLIVSTCDHSPHLNVHP